MTNGYGLIVVLIIMVLVGALVFVMDENHQLEVMLQEQNAAEHEAEGQLAVCQQQKNTCDTALKDYEQQLSTCYSPAPTTQDVVVNTQSSTVAGQTRWQPDGWLGLLAAGLGLGSGVGIGRRQAVQSSQRDAGLAGQTAERMYAITVTDDEKKMVIEKRRNKRG